MRAFEIEGWDKGTKIRVDSWASVEYIHYINGRWTWHDEDRFTFLEGLLIGDNWEPYEEPKLQETWYIHTYCGVSIGLGRSKIETLTKLTWDEFDLTNNKRIHISTVQCDKIGNPL
jgi:hypothetical protein